MRLIHRKITIKDKPFITKYFKENSTKTNKFHRTKDQEKDLLKNILREGAFHNTKDIRFPENEKSLDGCYAIIGSTNGDIYKLISGRRYESSFTLFNQKSVSQIESDYKIFYKYLSKSNFKIPKIREIATIEVDIKNPRRYLFLEKQERFEGENLLNLYTLHKINDTELLNEFKIILSILPSIAPYIGDKIGIDLSIPNFLSGGRYIDLLPPKVYKGFEYKTLNRQVFSEYSRIKLHRMFTEIGILGHLIATFITTAPHMTKDFLEAATKSDFGKGLEEELVIFLRSKRFRQYLFYSAYYFRNLARPTISEHEIDKITNQIQNYLA